MPCGRGFREVAEGIEGARGLVGLGRVCLWRRWWLLLLVLLLEEGRLGLESVGARWGSSRDCFWGART